MRNDTPTVLSLTTLKTASISPAKFLFFTQQLHGSIRQVTFVVLEECIVSASDPIHHGMVTPGMIPSLLSRMQISRECMACLLPGFVSCSLSSTPTMARQSRVPSLVGLSPQKRVGIPIPECGWLKRRGRVHPGLSRSSLSRVLLEGLIFYRNMVLGHSPTISPISILLTSFKFTF